MSQRERGLYSFLYHPRVYRWSQDLLGDRNLVRVASETLLRAKPGDRLLDLGCGTGNLLEFLPAVRYTGLDNNPEYIAFARKRYGDQGAFVVGDLGCLDQSVDLREKFELIALLGVTHHLSDETVLDLYRQARLLLTETGRVCVVDPCLHDRQPWIARQLAEKDRGNHVRRLEEYPRLAREVFPSVRFELRQGILRIPYSYLFMEMAAV
ncbi:MAG: class I SAM-dependent methyltransferase [Magnetococcales bacterium]|nr:class I SAM-dependent methyltransferase [Magnetococcales bacterium]